MMTKVSRTPQEKLPLVFEAAKRSLLTYQRLLRRLGSELDAVTGLVDAQAAMTGDDGADPLISAMGLVDFAHRFGQLVDATPLVSKKAPEARALRDALINVEEARHHLQHLRGDLTSAEPIDYPLLGALTWSKDRCCYTLAFSQAGTSLNSLVWDTQEARFVTELEYAVRDVRVDLFATEGAMFRAFEWLTGSFKFNPPSFNELKWGETLATKVDFSALVVPPGTHDGVIEADVIIRQATSDGSS